ncbi:MAG: DHHA1 domain-containing protein [Caldilineaceae bacterium]
MTERLYYTDSYQTQFRAMVRALTRVGEQPALVLDQSYFYPTSGGQAHDLGTLNGCQVVDVVAAESGEVLHLLAAEDGAAFTVGQPVEGQLDWARRYDHMQQHSGQHLLSQIFYRCFGYETVSVHFGALESTLDLETADLSAVQVDEAERDANQLLYRTLPIKAYFVTEAELAAVPLRRPPKVSGKIRIVEIDDFDYSACGGTHCRTTAELAPLKVTKVERRRDQVRVTFLCGQRAFADYALKHQLITEVANLFSNEIQQTPALVERNLAQIKELQRRVEQQQRELLGYAVQEWLAEAAIVNGYRLVVKELVDLDVNGLKSVASQLQQQAGVVALLGVSDASKATLIFSRATDVDVHVGNLLREVLRLFGGKGGGRPDYAQGGGIVVTDLPAALAAARHKAMEQWGAS